MTGQADKRPPPLVVPLLHAVLGYPFETLAIDVRQDRVRRVAALNMAGADTPFRGSLSMNVLNTLGLVSSSFGLWMGVEGGERCTAVDEARSRYLRFELEDDRIVRALALGLTQHVGVVRGLIQTRVRLGAWMEKLRVDPATVMNAYLECTQGGVQ